MDKQEAIIPTFFPTRVTVPFELKESDTQAHFGKTLVCMSRASVNAMSSFGLDEEENAATLTEALAFIDEFDNDSNAGSYEEGATSDQSTGSDNASVGRSQPAITSSLSQHVFRSGDGGSRASGERHDQAQRHLKQNSREANTKAVSRYRKRNKDEIQELREKMWRMEAHLAQLRRSHDAAQHRQASSVISHLATVTTDPLLFQVYANLIGIDRAICELRQRQESEALNRQLKDTLAAFVEMRNVPAALFQKPITAHVRLFCVLFVL